ncbi:MAG: hypothetical protein AB8F65_15045 [Woeseiaceae bacterium]
MPVKLKKVKVRAASRRNKSGKKLRKSLIVEARKGRQGRRLDQTIVAGLELNIGGERIDLGEIIIELPPRPPVSTDGEDETVTPGYTISVGSSDGSTQ